MIWEFKIFWTIWALGWWRVKSYTGKTIDLRIFIGPIVITRH